MSSNRLATLLLRNVISLRHRFTCISSSCHSSLVRYPTNIDAGWYCFALRVKCFTIGVLFTKFASCCQIIFRITPAAMSFIPTAAKRERAESHPLVHPSVQPRGIALIDGRHSRHSGIDDMRSKTPRLLPPSPPPPLYHRRRPKPNRYQFRVTFRTANHS